MASCITEQWSGSVCPQVRLTVTESSSTNTTVTFSWVIEYVGHGYEARTNGIPRDWSVTINGSNVGSGSYNINHVSTTKELGRGTTTVNKGYSGQNISFSLSFYFDLTWSGRYKGTSTASGTIWIGAKTSYTVSYNANGGSSAPSSQTKWYNEDLTLTSSQPSRDGYRFNGWSTSTDSTIEYNSGSTYSENSNMTLYAVWIPNKNTVSYNANGGTGAPASQTKTYGVNIVLSSTRPTRTDYRFVGWGLSPSSTTVVYSPGEYYTANSDITLYAVWELDYWKPRITDISVDRCDASGNLMEEGTYAKVTMKWATDRALTNIVIKWKKTSETSFTNSTTITSSQMSGTVSKVIGGAISAEYDYNVSIVVTDALGSSTASSTIPSLHYIIDFLGSGKGISFGKPATREGMDSNMIPHFATSLVGNLPITSGQNLNDIRVPGNYACASNIATTLGNCPVSIAFKMEVGYLFDNKTHIYQKITCMHGTYYREMYIPDSSWSNWINNTNQYTYNGTPSTNDFNNLTTPGEYWIDPGVTTVNRPVHSWGHLMVLPDGKTQIFIEYSDGNRRQVAVRSFTNNAWSPWAIDAIGGGGAVNAKTIGSGRFNVSTGTSTVTVNYSVPSNPFSVIAIPHGGAPFMCSVNSWSNTQAIVSVQATQYLSNRYLQLLLLY